jgi:hypothetical protein
MMAQKEFRIQKNSSVFDGPSDRIPKATKDDNEHFFIQNGNSCKLYQHIPGTF